MTFLRRLLCRLIGHTVAYPWLEGEPAPRRVCAICGRNMADLSDLRQGCCRAGLDVATCRAMGLVLAKKGGRDRIVGINATLGKRVDAFAEAGGYTFKSVIETAVEEFLDGQMDKSFDDVVGEAPPPPAAPSALRSVLTYTPGAIVAVRLDGRGPERLAEVLEEKGSGNVKLRVQTFGDPKKKATDMVLPAGDIKRAASESEQAKWKAIAVEASRRERSSG